MRERFEKLGQSLEELSLDAYYCRKTSDIRWLTGFSGVFDSEAAHLALMVGGDFSVHTDSRYSEAMRSNPAREGLDISDERISHAKYAATEIAKRADELGVGKQIRIGIESNIPLNEWRLLAKELQDAGVSFELVETEDPVLALRTVKDESEIELMKRAQKITDEAFADLLTWLEPGMTEMQVANEMEYKMRGLGATGLAFPTIAASGFHSAMPHAVPSEKKIEEGEFVVFDFGASFGDYCSDMTRTVAIGEVSQQLHEIYDIVLEAHEACKSVIRPGVERREVHELAQTIISKGGYPDCFGHSLGHGVGIDIHEMPTLSPRSTGVLEVGNVVTVEPGIYVPGVGGVRIEDFGVVREDGFEDFTGSPHELQTI
ncbi:MAG: M24 family metallopeptidase [Coriobacteriales bacterium]